MAAYCSFIGGVCAHGDHREECVKQSAITCRTLRDKNSAKESEDVGESVGSVAGMGALGGGDHCSNR
jgi:hypothetical protein